jgi:hypothetical protein
MRTLLLLVTAFAIAVLVVAYEANGASAQVTTSTKPTAVIDQALSRANIAAIKCWDKPWYIQWHRRSTAGLSLWKYRLTIDRFCWSGTKITAIHSFRSVKLNAPLWDFCCHLSQTRTWNGTWTFRRWTEGKFVWAGPVGLAVRTPEIWFKVRGDGFLDYGAVGD